MEVVLRLEVPGPDGLNVLEVLRAQIGLAGPLLHDRDLLGCSSHLVGGEWSEFLMTRHDVVNLHTIEPGS